jgi:hypothetical protein
VWSYAKCLSHLQQQLSKEGGGAGAGFGDMDETATVTDAGEGADREDGDEGEGDGHRDREREGEPPAEDTGSHAGTDEGTHRRRSLSLERRPSLTLGFRKPSVNSISGSSATNITPSKSKPNSFRLGRSSRQLTAQLLRAVASFALPTHAQLARLDPDYAHLVQRPSSFRLDCRGRFAAVAWSERIVCVYDIYPLHALCAQLRGAAALQAPANPASLTVFGAFPCRALPAAAGTEYSFGAVAFHPRTQVLLLTVLRHRAVPRSTSNPSHSAAVRLPLPPLLYAVSLRVHQPILSALGCYELGPDVDPAVVAAGSVNWRPQSLDCTPHTGLVVVGLQVTSSPGLGCGGILDDAPSVQDVTHEGSTAAWRAAVQADDDADAAVVGTPGVRPATSTHRAPRGTALLFLTLSFSPAWLQSVGLSYLVQPICSSLSVPADCFTHGEGVMSTRAAFTQGPSQAAPAMATTATKAGAPSFALVDRGGAEAPEISDLYPLLLTLRPVAEAGEGGPSVAPAAYHLFRTHWVFPSLRSGSSASATHIGKVPAVLKTPALEAAAAQWRDWLKLQGPEHDLSLTAWGNDSDALLTAEAHAAHTLYPSRLLTQESVGVRSLHSGSGGAWSAVLTAVVHRSVASKAVYNVAEAADVNAAAADRSLPCVLFLRHQPGNTATALQVAYTNLRAAAYWVRPAPVPGATAEEQLSVLALSRSGGQLLHLEYQSQQQQPEAGTASAFAADPFNSGGAATQQGGPGALVHTATWELGQPMEQIWTDPTGSTCVADS